jgi:FtsH-binding integral membrane protein
MQKKNEESTFSLSKYLSKIEFLGWGLCIFSMITIVFAKQLSPDTEPYAWIGAIIGAGIIGWGMARKHKQG